MSKALATRSNRRLRSRPRDVDAISATEAKNAFGRFLEDAIRGKKTVITKHDSPKAVLISIDAFNALSRDSSPDLETLSKEFDRLLASMQTPAVRAAMSAAFHATPKEMGKAAAGAARKRG
jgi:antitoxin Phd